MIVWADGGWDHRRGIGFASVHREGIDEQPVAVPLLRHVSSSLHCEYEALVLAVCLTPDSADVCIRTDSSTVVEQVSGKASCSVIEFAAYVTWLRRHLGSRRLEWTSRERNRAHIRMDRVYDSDESWALYELEVLRERRRDG